MENGIINETLLVLIKETMKWKMFPLMILICALCARKGEIHAQILREHLSCAL